MTNTNSFSALKIRDIQLFIGSTACFTLGSRALAVVIGFQIYQITHNALSLGWLGLVEAIPALSLVLFGGWVADHYNRRRILLITRMASLICAIVLTTLSLGHQANLLGLYSVIFLAGIARGFSDPASSAFEAQLVPKNLTVNASSWISSFWISCSVIGPAVIGFVFDAKGAAGCYVLIATWFLLSWICMLLIGPKPQVVLDRSEPITKSIALGWKFVFSNQALIGAMALDLFAVLFGGMIALLPVFALDILHVGAKGLGFLNAAPALGSLIIMLYATKHPPIEHAGRNLLLSVAGFGVSILLFAFSTNFYLSLFALLLTGVFDGVSMVIRRSMIRLLSPDEMRGRISSVGWIFICSSNELGAFESGMVASLIGAVACVWVGGLVTLGVVAAAAVLAPQLRQLKFDPKNLDVRPATDHSPKDQ
ncbi:MAG: MFS transporter [Candidatus Omnitrophica bacterium]|nr:MFS transporter [Candidatus Omnitrophota bacterium]